MTTEHADIAAELLDWLADDQDLSARDAVAVLGIAMAAIVSTLVSPQGELKKITGIMSRTLHEKGFDE